jgi:HlyD family secretion protein
MAKLIKILFGLVFIGLIAVGSYSWLQGQEPEDNGRELIGVERGSIIEKAVAVGQIEPRQEFSIKSKISGIVKKALVDVGDYVDPGDPLFEIVPDPTPAELVEAERRLESAESAYKRAQSDWNRSSELARQGVVSGDELDGSRESFELAKIEVARARDQLDLTRKGRIAGRGKTMESVIRAPAAGIVLERLVDPGDPVVPLTSFQEGTELATLADMSDLIFKGTVDEIDVGKLDIGVEARLKVGALPDKPVTGRLSRIAPKAKEEDGARLFEVEIELDPVREIVLRAGYSANADLVIREKTDILLIPERLILFEDDGDTTFVEIPGETAEAEPVKIEVETGLSDGLNIEVVTGLEEGNQVVQRPPRDILG